MILLAIYTYNNNIMIIKCSDCHDSVQQNYQRKIWKKYGLYKNKNTKIRSLYVYCKQKLHVCVVSCDSKHLKRIKNNDYE